jgi:hypothetical protein
MKATFAIHAGLFSQQNIRFIMANDRERWIYIHTKDGDHFCIGATKEEIIYFVGSPDKQVLVGKSLSEASPFIKENYGVIGSAELKPQDNGR